MPFHVHQTWIYMVNKKHSGKADQSTLVSVGISWGNKIIFSLCMNMSGFSSNSHILILMLYICSYVANSIVAYGYVAI